MGDRRPDLGKWSRVIVICLAVTLVAGGAALARQARQAPQRPQGGQTAHHLVTNRDVVYGGSGITVTDLNTGATPTQLAQSLAGAGISVSNVTYTGASRAAGAFTGGTGSVGFGSGVVLGTGKVETYPGEAGTCSRGVEGPNTCSANSTGFGTPGDSDLDALAGGGTQDAAVLQFDFVPASSTIQIDYVFSSDEYNEYVGEFDDVFGFFVDGQNCALVPGTNQPVSVNTINDGNGSIAPSNPQYFRDNVNPSPTIDSQMDGLTTVLTCTAAVTPGQVNHMKLAIADAGDASVDSAVFIQSRSLTSGISATGGQAFAGEAPYTLSGNLATFTDTTPGLTAASYQASINWGDGTTSAGTVGGSGGSYTVAGSHTYAQPGSYSVATTIAQTGNSSNTGTAGDQVVVSAPVTAGGVVTAGGAFEPPAPPQIAPKTPSVQGASAASFSGAVNPEGLATTARFEYGLDSKYSGGGPVVYDQSTPAQTVGADFAVHAFSQSVPGLVPNALYHVRLAASNSAGSAVGPDQTFMTGMQPAPGAPHLGSTANVVPVSGLVLIKAPAGKSLHARGALAPLRKGQGFVPLTQARQVPVGSQIDARRGTLKLIDASGSGPKTQQAGLAGGLFTISQNRTGISKGLTTFTLDENAFPGAPSYSGCPKIGKSVHADATSAARIAALSSKVLQTLRATDNHGSFRTRGRDSAGTVRGTDFTTTEQCNGTLTAVHRGIVDVLNFRLRTTIAVHAGHSYLASAVASGKSKTKH